jgi:hypothetical protein
MSELQEWFHGMTRAAANGNRAAASGIRPALMNTQERLRVVPATPAANTTEIDCAQSIFFLPCPSFSHEVQSMIRRLPALNSRQGFEAAARVV